MLKKTRRGFRYWLSGLILLMIPGAFGVATASSSNDAPIYHAAMPAGYDVVLLKPGSATVSFLALIECPELEGAQQVDQGVNARIITADGRPLANFPGDFSFRITASLRKTVMSDASTSINSSQNPNDFLLKLKFNLRVYDGMEVRSVEPQSVQMIGVPGDVPYDERIYRIGFDVSQLPVTDRFVLEIQSPEGERLTRFHFDLL